MAVTNRSLSRNYAPLNQRDENKHYMYPLVTGGVMLMIGLLLFSTFSQIRIIPDYVADACFIVPALFFFPVAYMAKRGSIPKKHSRIVTTILLVLGIVALPMNAMTTILNTYSAPVQGVQYYGKTMQLLGKGSNQLLDAFPTEVPVDSENAAFYYGTDMQTGTMRIELSFRTGEAMADPLENAMKSRAVWSGSMDELNASEYAAVIDHIPTEQPADAAYYIMQTTTYEDTGVIDSVAMTAAAPDGSLYYLYTLWMPQ